MEKNRIPSSTFGDGQPRSYLLRLWQEEPGGEQRAMLRNVLSGDRHHFSSLADLFTFLQERGCTLSSPSPANRRIASSTLNPVLRYDLSGC